MRGRAFFDTSLPVIAGVFLGIPLGVLLTRRHRMSIKPPKSEILEKLKNALLSFAIMKTWSEDPDLPRFSGCNTANACFTYIMEDREFRRSPFFTYIMETKNKRVRDYIAARLSTEKDVLGFFEDFVTKLTS
jgi:heat shock protein HspQ